MFDGAAWTLAQPITSYNSATGPDSIEVFYGDIESGEYDAAITQPMPDASAELNVDDTASFAVGDAVVITDGVTAALFVVSTVQAASLKLQHNPAESIFNPPAAFKAFPHAGGYGTGSRLFNFGAFRWVTYSIDRATDPLHPTLVADTHDGSPIQTIADNIEDLQFYYFLDGTAPDTNDPSGIEDKIKAIKISILARTDAQDRDQSNSFTPPDLEDHAVGAVAPDGYRRRLLSTTIRVRNL